ncbi:MAG: response regulator [Clostridia bacterium]|nr:response regulator [Clostridia bacterium]
MQQYNILSVDEFGVTRLELLGMLKGLNVNVIGVRNEVEAVNALHDNKAKINAIVWTINSIDFEEFGAIKQVKSKEAYKAIPVIIISKFTDKRYVIKAIEAGATEYIVKPYDENTVLKKLGSILGIQVEKNKGPRYEDDIKTFNFMEMFIKEIKSASRGMYALSIMMVSVIVHDQQTRENGSAEELIELFNKVVKTKLRETDSSFHYGADNLIILLPFANKEGVAVVEKKLQNLFNTHSLIKQKNKGYKLISAAVSFPDDGKIRDKLLERLEKNLEQCIKTSKP